MAMGMDGFQKLVGVSRKTFFEENVGDRERGAVDVENDYLADIDGRILLNDIFYLEQIILFLVGINKVVHSTAQNVDKAIFVQIPDISRVAPFPAFVICAEESGGGSRIL